MAAKTIYIAGKVTGEPASATAHKFKVAQIALEAQGYLVLNPIELVRNWCRGKHLAWHDLDWQRAMRICIAGMMAADEVFMLRDYKFSRGAMIEHDLAEKMQLPINYQ